MPLAQRRDGQVEAAIADLTDASQQRFQLGKLNPADHHAPAFVILVIHLDRKYTAIWARHRSNKS
ncbi:MAG: hypothetical protein WDO69_11205 [Pseudomonadota bacterium]